MRTLVLNSDLVLRGRLPVDPRRPVATVALLLTCTLVWGALYGAVMGSFGGFLNERIWQVFISAAKVPLLLIASFLMCLPSFFVLNTLLGLRNDFAAAVQALCASQAGLAIVLFSLAPFTAFWYASSSDYPAAVRFNGLMFAMASGCAQVVLWRYYRPLIRRERKHRWTLSAWLALFWLVAIQLAWILRPFVGFPGMPVQFFREESWGNAYVVIGRSIWEAVTR